MKDEVFKVRFYLMVDFIFVLLFNFVLHKKGDSFGCGNC